MSLEHKTGTFEIHIAGPKTELALARRVFASLQEVGLVKNKFFLGVYNISPTENLRRPVACTPPTGHDLADPGWMTTAKTSDYGEAKRYVLAGMNTLAHYGLEGNFEIERIISRTVPDYHIDVENEFPAYQRVPDSPAFENHFIWKDNTVNLPSNAQICDVIQQRFGIAPHQIVDFSKDPAGDSLVSRVATVYQPSREAALTFAEQLGKTEKLAGHRYMVTEQVCLVGEPKQ